MASLALEATLDVEPTNTKNEIEVYEIEKDGQSSSTGSIEDTAANVKANAEWVYPYPTNFQLSEHPIDTVRELSVAVIGAGLTGITAAILLNAKVPGIKLTIIEKNGDVGGTWLENSYPGVRCDIPSHVYQSTFAPNTQWSEEYSTGPEILRYWKSVAQKHDVHSKIRFNTKVLGCYWHSESAKWRLDTENVSTSHQNNETFDFVITAIGHFNKWNIPSWPGLDKFKGKLLHSSGWDPKFSAEGKRIATIGNGASGIQVTTELRKTAAYVDHYARSRTWIAGSFSPGSKERQDVPIPISEELKKSFEDPKVYLQYRKDQEDPLWRAFGAQIADSDITEKTRENFTELMRRRLAKDPSLLEKLVPDFPPHCRRLTPGPGYLEALTQPNLTLIQTPIKEFTEDGITTIDGIHRPVDAVICSTGANVDFAPPFPIQAGEFDLSRDWKEDGKFGWPYTYLGIATPGFPNLAYLLGPNSAGPSGTVPYAVESMVTYVAQMLRKMSRQGIRTMVPSKEAADAFVQYSDAFFPRTNLAKNCSSWSNGGKPGNRIHGHWPGSAAHLARVRAEPRWEDFEYTYERPENRFAYFGNGWSQREIDGDVTSYLRLPEENDLRALHERWWDV